MKALTVKLDYSPEGQYSSGARYPDNFLGYDWSEEPTLEWTDIIDSLPTLMRSDDIHDRVRARLYLKRLNAHLPKQTWCVIETEDSPNLNHDRDYRATYSMTDHVWSAHESEADAAAWLIQTRKNFEVYIEHNSHWGPGAYRTFDIAQVDHVPAHYLRQLGADPERHCSAFRS